jgi:hypothetical protein
MAAYVVVQAHVTDCDGFKEYLKGDTRCYWKTHILVLAETEH